MKSDEEDEEGNKEEEEKVREGNKEEEEDSVDEQDDTKHTLLKDDIDHGEVSSIASSIFNQTRSYFSLRNAIDEHYVPLSIRNLKIVANFVFIALLVLDVSQFGI